ncbi:Tat pathway signal sequence domain protein [Denitrobaculum tricleocarpae]|uniref:Tat pathway signal sequence domain protein n=1 Tax=Denitrobaculum tricleocarpae TaxID=2591009 RepID=A0A545TGD0_9PROT|nr:Tat pathway signal sequence domain protein [Denitrobaculum tricleocarpae]TQV76300.1 Tat pathway signal sequence domain protein [Denitrobaculum tricleocarpae]
MEKRSASTAMIVTRSAIGFVLLAAVVIALTPWSSARSENAPGAAQETGPQTAQETGPEIKIELNKLEASENACRAYLLLENRSPASFESLKLDLVLFDSEGVVAKRLAVEAAPLPKDKTSLKVFDIARMRCDAIGRVLLNRLTACDDNAGARSDCLAMISTTARGAVPFIK